MKKMNMVEMIALYLAIFCTGMYLGKNLYGISLQINVTIPGSVLTFIICGLLIGVCVCAKQSMVEENEENNDNKAMEIANNQEAK